jgi:hypothetical protein
MSVYHFVLHYQLLWTGALYFDNKGHGSRYVDRDLNLGPLKYETGVVTNE